MGRTACTEPQCLYEFTFYIFYKCNARKPEKLRWYSDSLQTGRSGDRIPLVVRFSATDNTSSEAHPASNTIGTGSVPGVKRPGVALTTHRV